MSNEKSFNLITIFIILLLLFLGFSIAKATQNLSLHKIITPNKEIPNSTLEIINDCTNLSLEKTAYCLRDNIKTFYKYKVTPDYLDLNLTELKKQGGDCKNYADLYVKLIKGEGFYGEHIIIDVDASNAHAFAVMSNGNGYCILDELNVWCNQFTK
ncbi:MAG: hypothetical protein GXO79_11520 [Chlorobi bacterium]|nr:hypothetical protein [Chlorobiota bacterium]